MGGRVGQANRQRRDSHAGQPAARRRRAHDIQSRLDRFHGSEVKKAIVRAMTTGDQVKIDSSHDEGQTWQPLSAIRQEWQQVAAGYFSQTPPDSLLLTITIGRKDGKDEARQVCWIRSRDGGRSWSRPAVVMNLPPHTHAWDPSRSRVKGDGLTVPTMKSSPLGKSVDFGRWSSGATILDGLGTRQLRFHSRQMETLE